MESARISALTQCPSSSSCRPSLRSTSCSFSPISLHKPSFWEEPTDRDDIAADVIRIRIEASSSQKNLDQVLSDDLSRNGKPETLQDILPPTALETFSSSNLPLPPLEFGTVSEECQILSQKISSLEDRISCLQASIADLSSAKETLERRLQEYKPLIHPVRRLPDDVLSYVFRICVDTEVEERQKKDSSYCQRYPGSLNTRKAPWLLGQICTKWRALTESLPQLWTVVDLDWRYDPLLREYHPAMDRLLSTQLQRCRGQQLAVSYCGLEAADPANPLSSNIRLLLILCSRSFQWSKVTIRADAVGLLALSSYKGMFPNLNTLHLHLLHPVRPAWIRASDNQTIFDAFHDTPNLRKLTITGYIDGIRDLSLQLPWNQITHYSVHNDFNWHTKYGCDDFSRGAYNTATVAYARAEPPAHRVGGIGYRPPAEYAHNSFATCPPINLWTDSSSALLSFLRRSGCTLEELAILRSVLDDDALVRLLGSDVFGGVKTLELGGTSPLDLVNISDEVILPLTLSSPTPPSTPVPIPRLRCLVLHDEKAWSDAVFVEMIRSRRVVRGGNGDGAVSRLEKVILQDAVTEGESVIKDEVAKRQLRVLCEDGLVFEVRWTPEAEEELYQ
ncbi:hypothetical protein AAF712_015491 [Marasmius tenuissimus]|uniref:F-box domain-containing protein n=1 Tax=Marasmius tenuissimus TaxID=585030 RepID=A0ABR2Z842_9AGAR